LPRGATPPAGSPVEIPPAGVVLKIERIVQGGVGLGRSGGKALFVPYTLPGEEVSVQITRTTGDYLEGEAREILRPVPERVVPLCPLFGLCGGCQLQHAVQSAQLQYKVDALRETLLRIGKIEHPPILPAIASPDPFHYRSRVRLQVAHSQVGFYARRSHRVVPVTACPLLVPSLNRALAFVQEHLSLQPIVEIEIQGNPSEEILIILRGDDVPEDACRLFYEMSRDIRCRGVVVYTRRGRMVFGQDSVIHPVNGRVLRVSDRSFFQVNGGINRTLVETALAWVAPTPSDTLLELYSGVGNFTLPFAESARHVTAIEAHPVAVRDARWNVAKAGLKNVTFCPTSVEAGLLHILKKRQRYASVFLDPPREGVSTAALRALSDLAPARIVYLSCNPATLARDLQRLSSTGYGLHRIAPFEMFPQTAHLEVLVELRLQS